MIGGFGSQVGMRQVAERPKAIVDGNEHDSFFGECRAVVDRVSARSAGERTAVNPDHDRQFVSRLCGGPDIQIEAVLALFGWRGIVHRSLGIWSLRTLGAKSVTGADAVPGNYGLRSFPSETAHRRSGKRDAFEGADTISRCAGDLAALNFDYVGRAGEALSRLSGPDRNKRQCQGQRGGN